MAYFVTPKEILIRGIGEGVVTGKIKSAVTYDTPGGLFNIIGKGFVVPGKTKKKSEEGAAMTINLTGGDLLPLMTLPFKGSYGITPFTGEIKNQVALDQLINHGRGTLFVAGTHGIVPFILPKPLGPAYLVSIIVEE